MQFDEVHALDQKTGVLARTRGKTAAVAGGGPAPDRGRSPGQKTLRSVRWSFRRQEPAQGTGDHSNVSTVKLGGCYA